MPAVRDYPYLNFDLFTQTLFSGRVDTAHIAYRAMQGQVVRLSAQWSFFQYKNGKYFNTHHPMVKRIIDYYNMGIEVIPVIQIDAPWAAPAGCESMKSFPPIDF